MKLLLLTSHLCLAFALKFNEAPPFTAKAAVESEVNQLIQRIQEADRGAVKQLFAEILRRGGQKHLEDVLAKFAAQGYDYNVLLQWLAGGWELGEHAVHGEEDHGFKLLLEGLKASNKTTVREAFGRMLRGGGPAFMAKKLEELQRMGYVIEDIKQWYTSKDGSSSSPQAAAAGEVDAQDLIKFVKSQDQGALRIKITEIYNHGGDPRIHAALKAVQALGYEPKEVERLAAAKLEKQEAKQLHSTPATTSAPAAEPAASATEEALQLVKSIAANDRTEAEKELASILATRGPVELQSVLHRAAFRGHDAKQIQDWIADAAPAPPAQLRLARQDQTASNTTAPAAPASTVPATVVAAMPSAPMSSTMAPVTVSTLPAEAHPSPNAWDTEFLVARLRAGDRSGAGQGLTQMFAAGGQRRIQRALAGLKTWGYDPGRFQQWVAEGVPSLLVGKATDRENTAMAMVDALKKWDRKKAANLLDQVFRSGGPSKVQEVLGDLKSMGYSPSEVERWIYAKQPAVKTEQVPGALPAVPVTALAAEPKAQKVKVLGVHDFRIAVSDLSTAKLTNAA